MKVTWLLLVGLFTLPARGADFIPNLLTLEDCAFAIANRPDDIQFGKKIIRAPETPEARLQKFLEWDALRPLKKHREILNFMMMTYQVSSTRVVIPEDPFPTFYEDTAFDRDDEMASELPWHIRALEKVGPFRLNFQADDDIRGITEATFNTEMENSLFAPYFAKRHKLDAKRLQELIEITKAAFTLVEFHAGMLTRIAPTLPLPVDPEKRRQFLVSEARKVIPTLEENRQRLSVVDIMRRLGYDSEADLSAIAPSSAAESYRAEVRSLLKHHGDRIPKDYRATLTLTYHAVELYDLPLLECAFTLIRGLGDEMERTKP